MSSEALARLKDVAGQVALVARSLDDMATPLVAELQPEAWFPAASVIKIGIMSALLEGVAKGQFCLDDELLILPHQMVGGAGILFELREERSYSLAELCRLMMTVSDNTASNALARLIGLDELNRFFEQRGYQAQMQRFFMDPVRAGKDNRMTALSAAQMLADLYQGKNLTPELQDFAVGCLRRQQYREKLPLMLPEELVVGHKTGELDGVRHDAAVVETTSPYILVVLTSEGGPPWEVDLAMARTSLQIFQEQRVQVSG